MSIPMSSQTSLEQREHWARKSEQWVREADRYDAMHSRFGEAMLDAARLKPGERVLDVGCGAGATTVDAAKRVAPGGAVVGADISAPMLALAAHHAEGAGVDNLELLEVDAQAYPFKAEAFDAVVSRFGTMFFGDPELAFANLARALRPGGRLALVCWQDVLQSEWTAVLCSAFAARLGFPDFGLPGAPGPYAFADCDRLGWMIETGGFRDITLEAITRPMRVGEDVDDVVTFFTSFDLVRSWLAGHAQAQVAAALDAGREALMPYAGPEGVVMHGTAWLVSAQR